MAHRIVNDSPVPKAQAKKMVDWVFAQFPSSVDTMVCLSAEGDEVAEKHGLIAGAAYPMAGWKYSMERKHWIEIIVPTEAMARDWGITQQYLTGPKITFEDWEEEFVTTLAHEVAHLLQFEAGKEWRSIRAEARAEEAAVVVLAHWRRQSN